jgi:hypothetical protein
MVQKVISQAQAREELDKQDALKKRAARQAAKALVEQKDIPFVECTVLPMGDGKISMGEHVGGLGEVHYEEGETFTIQLPVAVALFDRGYVNFEGAREASNTAKEGRARQEAQLRAGDIYLQKLLEQA